MYLLAQDNQIFNFSLSIPVMCVCVCYYVIVHVYTRYRQKEGSDRTCISGYGKGSTSPWYAVPFRIPVARCMHARAGIGNGPLHAQ